MKEELIEHLKIELKYSEAFNEAYLKRIEKAILFIKKNASYDTEARTCCDDLTTYECDKLLEILGYFEEME